MIKMQVLNHAIREGFGRDGDRHLYKYTCSYAEHIAITHIHTFAGNLHPSLSLSSTDGEGIIYMLSLLTFSLNDGEGIIYMLSLLTFSLKYMHVYYCNVFIALQECHSLITTSSPVTGNEECI